MVAGKGDAKHCRTDVAAKFNRDTSVILIARRELAWRRLRRNILTRIWSIRNAEDLACRVRDRRAGAFHDERETCCQIYGFARFRAYCRILFNRRRAASVSGRHEQSSELGILFRGRPRREEKRKDIYLCLLVLRSILGGYVNRHCQPRLFCDCDMEIVRALCKLV